MSDAKKIQKVRKAMLEIYGEGCWMGYKLCRENPYSYHHILEARKGGRITIDNGAILTRFAHDDLNALERKASYLYHDLNVLFKELNETRRPPTKEYFKEINGILVYASEIIQLSRYCELNVDFVLQKEVVQMTQENQQKNYSIPKYSYRKRCEEEQAEIPHEYMQKIKKKNRNNGSYKYY